MAIEDLLNHAFLIECAPFFGGRWQMCDQNGSNVAEGSGATPSELQSLLSLDDLSQTCCIKVRFMDVVESNCLGDV